MLQPSLIHSDHTQVRKSREALGAKACALVGGARSGCGAPEVREREQVWEQGLINEGCWGAWLCSKQEESSSCLAVAVKRQTLTARQGKNNHPNTRAIPQWKLIGAGDAMFQVSHLWAGQHQSICVRRGTGCWGEGWWRWATCPYTCIHTVLVQIHLKYSMMGRKTYRTGWTLVLLRCPFLTHRSLFLTDSRVISMVDLTKGAEQQYLSPEVSVHLGYTNTTWWLQGPVLYHAAARALASLG